MARRNNSDGGGLNLDSLMDALTNVVAVLILVLLLVNADVTQKVQKFLEELQPATPEEIQASKKKVEELEKRKETLLTLMKEEAPTPEEVEEERRKLALLEKSTEESKVRLKDADKLKEFKEKIRKERDKESEETISIQEEIAKIEGLLDETPIIKAPEATVVNIPNSRPIPADARIYHAMVMKNRVHIIDSDRVRAIFDEEFRKNRKDWLVERIQRRGADRYIYDGQKIEKYFANFNWGLTNGQRVEVRSPKTSTRIRMTIFPDIEKGGTPTEELATVGSNYSKAALIMSRDFKAVLLFHVNPDSFNTYLEARALADKANIAAGWEIKGPREFNVPLPEDLEVVRLEEPPPRPDTPPGPRPPKPPPIGPKLD